MNSIVNDKETGNIKSLIMKTLHENPKNERLCKYITPLFLASDPTRLNHAAASCSKRACRKDIKNALLLTCLSALSAGHHSQAKTRRNAFKSVQKFIHLHPNSIRHWALLAAASHGQAVIEEAKGKDVEKRHVSNLKLTTFVMLKVEADSDSPGMNDLHLWCARLYVTQLLSSKREEEARQFLEQALWLYEDDNVLKILSAFVECNSKALRELTASGNKGNAFGLQLLLSILIKLNLKNDFRQIANGYSG